MPGPLVVETHIDAFIGGAKVFAVAAVLKRAGLEIETLAEVAWPSAFRRVVFAELAGSTDDTAVSGVDRLGRDSTQVINALVPVVAPFLKLCGGSVVTLCCSSSSSTGIAGAVAVLSRSAAPLCQTVGGRVRADMGYRQSRRGRV